MAVRPRHARRARRRAPARAVAAALPQRHRPSRLAAVRARRRPCAPRAVEVPPATAGVDAADPSCALRAGWRPPRPRAPPRREPPRCRTAGPLDGRTSDAAPDGLDRPRPPPGRAWSAGRGGGRGAGGRRRGSRCRSGGRPRPGRRCGPAPPPAPGRPPPRPRAPPADRIRAAGSRARSHSGASRRLEVKGRGGGRSAPRAQPVSCPGENPVRRSRCPTAPRPQTRPQHRRG